MHILTGECLVSLAQKVAAFRVTKLPRKRGTRQPELNSQLSRWEACVLVLLRRRVQTRTDDFHAADLLGLDLMGAHHPITRGRTQSGTYTFSTLGSAWSIIVQLRFDHPVPRHILALKTLVTKTWISLRC